MPLLADAYSDAHLNTATLDNDINTALRKLEAAMKRLDKAATVTLRLETKTADAKLREFEKSVDRARREIGSNSANLRVEVDNDELEALSRQLETDVQDRLPPLEISPQILGEEDLFDAFDELDERLSFFDDPVDIPIELDDERFQVELVDLLVDLKRLRTERVNIDVDSDVQTVNTEIKRIQSELAFLAERATNLPVLLDDDEFQLTLRALKLELEAFDEQLAINASVDIDGLAEAIIQLEELKAEAASLEDTINLGVDTDTAEARSDLLTLQAIITALEARVNVQAEADIGAAIAALRSLDAAKQVTETDIDIQADVDTSGAFAQLAALKTAKDALNDGGGLGSLFGGGGGGGLGGFSAIGPALIAAIVGAVAALGPFVTGLIGGAVALLGLGAAASVAAGGLAALALFTDKELKETFAQLGSNFARLTRDVLEPLIDFFQNTVGPALFSVLTELTLKLGPSIQGFLEPIIGEIFSFILALANSAAPLLDELGAGFGSLIEVFTSFIPSLVPVVEQLTGPFFNGLNGLIALFLGTARAAEPAISALLDGIGNGARGLIGPINRLVDAFTPLLLSLGGPLSQALGQLGPIWKDLGAAVFGAVELISEAINSLGLDNILFLIGGVVAAFGGWVPAILLALTGTNQLGNAVEAVKNAFVAFGPAISSAVGIVRTVLEAVLTFFSAVFEQIDFTSLASGVQSALSPLAAVAAGLLQIAQPLGTALGALINAVSRLLPLLQVFVAFKLAQWFVGLIGPIGAAITRLVQFIQVAIQTAAIQTSAFFRGAAGGAGGLFSGLAAGAGAIGATSLATGGLTVALVAGAAAYSAWSTAKANAEEETRRLTDALLTEEDALQATSDAFTEQLVNRDAIDDLNDANLAITDLTSSLQETPGQLDEFREFWQGGFLTGAGGGFFAENLFGGLGQEPIGLDTEQLEELERRAARAGVTIPEAYYKINEAVNSGDLDLEVGKELINDLTNLDKASEQAVEKLKATFNDLKATIDNLGLGNLAEIQQLLPAVSAALASGNPEEARTSLLGLEGSLFDLYTQGVITEEQFRQFDKAINISGDGVTDYNGLIREAQSELEELGIRADDVYNAALPNTSRVLSKLAAALDEGTIATESFKKASERAQEEQRKLGEQGQETVRRLQQGGRISEFFKVEAREIQSAAEQAQQFANAFVEGVTLGGRLSDFVRNEAVEVDRTINDFLENLRLQAENAARLSVLTRQGFGALAVQLATLASNPEQLQGFLDELGSRGQAGFAEANGRIQAGIDSFARTIGTLDPVTREALGLDQTLQQLQQSQDSLSTALDQFAQNMRLRISNIRRLNELSAQGFTPLAVQLGDLFGDPTSLNAALDQLDAAGTGFKSRANRQFADLNAAYIAAGDAADAAIAASIGFDQTEQKFADSQATIEQAIAEYGRGVLIQLSNVERLFLLEEAGFSSTASFLTNAFLDDPEGLQRALDEWVRSTDQVRLTQEDQLRRTADKSAEAVAYYSKKIAEFPAPDQGIVNQQATIAGQSGTRVGDEYAKGVKTAIENGLPGAIINGTESAFAQVGSGIVAPPPAPGVPAPGGGTTTTSTVPTPPSGQDVARLYAEPARLAAQAFANGFAGELRNITASIMEAALRAPDGFLTLLDNLDNPDGEINKYGVDIANRLLLGFNQGLIEGDEFRLVKDGFEEFADKLIADDGFQSVASAFRNSGEAARVGFVQALLGITSSTGEGSIVTDVLTFFETGANWGTAIKNGVTSQAEPAATQFFDTLKGQLDNLVAADQSVGVLQESTLRDFGVRFGTAIAGGINLALAGGVNIVTPLQSLQNLLFLIGIEAGIKFGQGFNSGYSTASIAIAQQVGTNLQSLKTSIIETLGEGGRAAGDALANSMLDGINSPQTLQTLRTAVFFFVVEAQTSIRDSGPDIGREFINGIKLGVDETSPALLLAIQTLANSIRTAMEAALDINSPSGVGMMIGNQFVQGIVVGLEQSAGQLTTAASTLQSSLTGEFTAPVQVDATVAAVAAPAAAVLATPTATTTTDTALLQQMLVELQTQNAELRAVAARPLIGEYNVATTAEPQSPDQLAQDAAFVKALLL